MNQPRGFTAPVSARSPFVDSARVSYYASSHAMKEIFKSLTSVCRLAFVVVISAAGSSVMAQSPTPSPQDKRGLGIESNGATNSQTDQSKSREAKPELVLQTSRPFRSRRSHSASQRSGQQSEYSFSFQATGRG